jgi:hypothetical protein
LKFFFKFFYIGASQSIDTLDMVRDIFQKEFQAVKFELKSVKELMPTSDFVITPSEACKTKADNTYRDLMEALKLPVRNDLKNIAKAMKQEDVIYDTSVSNILFDWNQLAADGKAIKEPASYPHVVAYLKKEFSIDAFNVDSGKGLMNSQLFDVKIYTLRSATDKVIAQLRGTYSERMLKYCLRGHPDVVILNDANGGISCGNLCCSIEIKPSAEFNTPSTINAGLREGNLQLIGTNASNVYSSPSVLVTDLQKNNFLMYLTIADNAEIALKFDLEILSFTQFNYAIQYVKFHVRKPISRFFASSSPKVSPTGSAAKADEILNIVEKIQLINVENDDDGEEVNEKVLNDDLPNYSNSFSDDV